MAQFLEVPPARLTSEVLDALLEEFASRDGTDYGVREVGLEEKVSQLRVQLEEGSVALLYDSDSEQWDLLAREQAQLLLSDHDYDPDSRGGPADG